jgi:polar amino acid transport system substrate-binding protein
MKQLAEGRVDYLLADKAMIDEMNILLADVGEKPVYVSKSPLIKVDVTLAMNQAFKGTETIINDFNNAIASLKSSPKYAELMQTDLARKSLLDERIYTDMLRKW